MTSERPTVRPVTLGRLVETAHACQQERRTTQAIEEAIAVTHRRARETILEALRLDLIDERDDDAQTVYRTTPVGDEFLDAIKTEDWAGVSDILEEHSPHYCAFLVALQSVQPATLETVLERLDEVEDDSERTYNQTSVEVLGDWAERLGVVQRNAFTGEYCFIEHTKVSTDFPDALLDVYDRLEEVAGVNLRQRYLAIPELREQFCTDHRCTRQAFDEALERLASENIGKLELSGAPLDTSAKDAAMGIKSIERADEGGLVSTSQSSDRVMAGVEQHGKHYYFLAVFDRDLTFSEEASP